MTTIQNFYPAGPVNISATVTDPSASFKLEVKKVMGSITLFFIVYFLLIIFSVALGIGCVIVGITVIAGLASLIGLILGLGIISIGVMVFVFLIKFVFSVKKFDEAGSMLISETEQPHLFDFIRQLTIDTQTQFPNKIILSPEVNACVFYNDSFWSMFFPVKKNLQIGLGLVNTLTVSEFKAVMAHEFGHFSQRSMKLGTFVYNVNKAIYNMLYENKDYGRFLERWGSIHWGIGIFMWVTIQIVKGIQSILQSMYSFINKNYMSLSREMEFHADAVAASVSGSDNLIRALRKAELSDFCYNSVLQKANDSIEEKAVFENIYTKHHIVMERYAEDNDLVLENNVPIADDAFFKRFQLSRINISNQWASHPSREDREDHLQQLNIVANVDNRTAWVLFTDPLHLQLQLTGIIYRNIPPDARQKTINEESFKEKLITDIKTYSLPEKYNGYYDSRIINEMEIENVLATPYPDQTGNVQLIQLVSDDKVALPKQLAANQSDALTLERIIKKEIETKTFDFDGEKYDKESASLILEKLKKQIEEQEASIQKNDEVFISFFYKAALQKGQMEASRLRRLYIDYFDNRKLQDKHFQVCQRIVNILLPLLHGQSLSIEKANRMAAGLREDGKTLKEILSQWMEKNAFEKNIPLEERVSKFLQTNYQYFSDTSFFDNELDDIHYLVNNGLDEINSFQFRNFKRILEFQLGLL